MRKFTRFEYCMKNRITIIIIHLKFSDFLIGKFIGVKGINKNAYMGERDLILSVAVDEI